MPPDVLVFREYKITRRNFLLGKSPHHTPYGDQRIVKRTDLQGQSVWSAISFIILAGQAFEILTVS